MFSMLSQVPAEPRNRPDAEEADEDDAQAPISCACYFLAVRILNEEHRYVFKDGKDDKGVFNKLRHGLK
jgi:hypothetical protein